MLTSHDNNKKEDKHDSIKFNEDIKNGNDAQ